MRKSLAPDCAAYVREERKELWSISFRKFMQKKKSKDAIDLTSTIISGTVQRSRRDNQGIYVKLICEESNPKREYKNHKDRVYKDSAMEIFMAFPEKGEPLTNDVMYINFEMNANGAMYACYGKGRKNRSFISEALYEKSDCQASVEEEKWSLTVTIPEELLKEICDFDGMMRGDSFYCNFYKISERPEIEHYGSFSPIESEKPNFHLPVCFAECKCV